MAIYCRGDKNCKFSRVMGQNRYVSICDTHEAAKYLANGGIIVAVSHATFACIYFISPHGKSFSF